MIKDTQTDLINAMKEGINNVADRMTSEIKDANRAQAVCLFFRALVCQILIRVYRIW
jgi:hypothetical protein